MLWISFVPSPNPSHPLQSFIHQLNSLWPFQHRTIIHVKHVPLSLYSLFQNFMVSHFNISAPDESFTAPSHVRPPPLQVQIRQPVCFTLQCKNKVS
jgi:hypothetical protein